MNDFLKFATAQGMNSMHVEQVMHDSMAAQPRANYISPSILEERQLNVTQMDVFSRLMMDRIIFLGTEINDYTANVMGIYDTMQFVSSKVSTMCTGMAASMGAVLLVAGEAGMRSALPHSRVMIHQPMGGIQGQASDIEITAREILKLKDELYQIIADHSHQTIDKIRQDADRDYWMTAQEALNYGMIDRVYTKAER